MTKHHPAVDYEDLESEFDYANESGGSNKRQRIQDDELWKKVRPGESTSDGRTKAKRVFDEEQSRTERQKRRLMTLDVYARHKELINQYYLCYPGATAMLQRDTSKDRTDLDFLKSNHKFLWDEDELSKAAEKSWEARLAKRYYDKLFKEYCIVDLSQYKKNRFAMRWRTENEVKSGKGQFECGSKRCSNRTDLASWEVNFAYMENNEKKNALVKLRLCPSCSEMLNFHSQKRRVTKKSRHKKRTYSPKSCDAETPTSSAETSAPSLEKEEEKSEGLKNEVEKMMEIWRKPQDEIDSEKAAEEELDDFLDDMFL